MRRKITYFDIHAGFSFTFDQSTQPCRKGLIKVAKIGNMEEVVGERYRCTLKTLKMNKMKENESK